MRSLVLSVLALCLVACGELPRTAVVAPSPVAALVAPPECPGSVELHSTAPACLVGRDMDTGTACFWRCQ